MLVRISWRRIWRKNSMPQKPSFQAPNCEWYSDWYQAEIRRMRCSVTKRHSGQLSVAREVDETALDVGANQLHADVVAHVETLETALQPPFDRRLEDPHPCSLRRGAGDKAINSSPILPDRSRAAADSRPRRSTLVASSSLSVQCLASSPNSGRVLGSGAP